MITCSRSLHPKAGFDLDDPMTPPYIVSYPIPSIYPSFTIKALCMLKVIVFDNCLLKSDIDPSFLGSLDNIRELDDFLGSSIKIIISIDLET